MKRAFAVLLPLGKERLLGQRSGDILRKKGLVLTLPRCPFRTVARQPSQQRGARRRGGEQGRTQLRV